ncbi:hypothetical protein D9599_27395 [Roseomonas sp. KE2513]|nr:hypothetical protein [Roseomonas sp. KE2513]
MGSLTSRPGDDRLPSAVLAIAALADCARQQHLTAADDLLVEILMLLLTTQATPSHEERVAAEDCAIGAMRLLCEPAGPK